MFNNSLNVKKFDLVAVVPETATSLQNLLKSAFRPDILAFDHERAQVQKLDYHLAENSNKWFFLGIPATFNYLESLNGRGSG